MSALTLTKTPVAAFDRTDRDAIADEMLLASAAGSRVGTVGGARVRGTDARQSADARAWTRGGQVD